MRTTLTLDDEVAKRLKDEAYRAGTSFKQTVNDTLRAGLAARSSPPRKPYRIQPVSLGGPQPGINLDRCLELAAALEDEETARELELRK